MSIDNQVFAYQMLENYLVLLLGVVDRPVKSKIHLQKEMFILSRTAEYINDVTAFEKHQFGPFSSDIQGIIVSPIYYKQPFLRKNSDITLSPNGKKIYKDLISEYSHSDKFQELLATMKMIRELYDRLTTDELLFLIYI